MSDLERLSMALVEAVQRDDTGLLVGGKLVGGNGGLLSRETLIKADMLRRELESIQAWREGFK